MGKVSFFFSDRLRWRDRSGRYQTPPSMGFSPSTDVPVVFFFVCVRSFPSFLLFIFGVCLDGRLGQPVIRHRAPPVALVGQNRRSDHRAVFLAKKLADDAVVMQVNILGWQPPSCTQKSTKKTRKGPITVAGMPSERRLTTGGRRSGGGDFASKSEEFHSPV